MELFKQLDVDIKTAMKAKKKEELKVLRMLKSSLKDIVINEGKEVTDEIFLDVLVKSVKQRKDSIDSFISGGREDLVEKEKADIEILSKYMPEQLSEEEAEELCRGILIKNEITEKKDMGKAMKLSMVELKGKIDGKLVSKIVGKILG